MHRLFLVVLIVLSAAACLAQTPEAIWDRPIMAQPFDKGPFHEIKIPAWVQETIGCGYTLSGMDFDARSKAAAHGVKLSEMGFVDPFYAYYDSKLLERRSPHVPLDRLPKDIDEYKKLGVRILGVYPPCLQGEVYEKHPEWRRIATNTTEIPTIDLKQFPHGGMLCLLGPYGDFFIDVLAEIVTKFPEVDAFSFDGLHYGGVCYCQQCRENFRRDAQVEIPNADLNDPAFRRYQHWADRRMEDLVRRMQIKLKGINPNVALVTWTTNAGRFGHFLSIPRNMPTRMNLLLDAPDQEFWLDETNRGTTIVPALANAYIWATTNHRVAFSEPYILSHGNPYGKDSFPPQEIQRRMLMALTYGAAPSIAVAQPANLQQELYDCMDEVERRKPWLTHKKPEPWAALVLSDNTRNFYGRSAGLVEERYMANVFGAFRAGVEEHLPVTVINDWNLNDADLAPYKVLILPNTACLDAAQTAAIERFVAAGGGLVASLDTSLFDEFGTPRSNFALAKVLGVDYRGLPDTGGGREALDVNFAQSLPADYWEKRKNVFDFKQDPTSLLNQGRMKTYVGDQPVTFKGPAVRVALNSPEAKSIGTLVAKNVAGAEPLPGAVTHTFGKGRVVYFACGLDAAYYLYAYPYQRLALAHAVRHAAAAPQPVTVEAPMCVHATVMRQQKDGERLVVHLFNDLNTTAHHALPVDDVPLREETVPIHDIRVTFGSPYRLKNIHLEPGALPLAVERTDKGQSVVVPKLEVHAMVVAELEAEDRRPGVSDSGCLRLQWRGRLLARSANQAAGRFAFSPCCIGNQFMLQLLVAALMAPVLSAEPVALGVGSQLVFRGAVSPAAEDDGGGKTFDLTLWIIAKGEARADVFWLVDERGRGEAPWTERFGRASLDGRWRASVAGPKLLYDRGEGRSFVNVPLPFLAGDAPLAEGATFQDGQLDFAVERASKVGDRPAWRVSVRDPFGPKRTLRVDQRSPLVLSLEERLTMGQGQEFKLAMELVTSEQLAGEPLAALARTIDRLSTLRGKLNLPAESQELQLKPEQVELLSKELPELEKLAAGTALAQLALAAGRDLKLQSGRQDAVSMLGSKYEGREVEPFELAGVDGAALKSADLAGKVTVLHFWDYRDEPLKEPYGQVGYLDFLYQRRKAAGLQVLGVAVDGRLSDEKTKGAAQRSVKKLKSFMNLSYPLLLDSGSLLKQFGDPRVIGASLPLFVVIGPDQKILHYHVGTYDVTQDQGLKQLDQIVGAALEKQK